MRNSVLASIIKVRDALANQSSSNFDYLNNLLNTDQDLGQTLVSKFGNYVDIARDEQGVLAHIYDGQGHILNSARTSTVQELLDMQLSTSTGVSLNDTIKSIGDSSNYYETLANMTSSFTTKTKVQSSELLNVVEERYKTTDWYSDIKDVVLQSTDEQGYVASTNWLLSLKTILSEAQSYVDGPQFQVDSTKPNYISNSIAIIFGTVMSIVGTVLSAVFAAIGGIIGVIGAVLSSMMSILGKILSSTVQPTMTVVDASASMPYLEQVPIAMSFQDVTDSAGASICYSEQLSLGQATCLDLGPIDLYLWPDSSYTSEVGYLAKGLHVNGFVSLQLHPIRTMNWLCNTVLDISFDSATTVFIVQYLLNHRFTYFDSSCYMTADELAALPYAGIDWINLCCWVNLICLSLRHVDMVDWAVTPLRMLRQATRWTGNVSLDTYLASNDKELIRQRILTDSIFNLCYASTINWGSITDWKSQLPSWTYDQPCYALTVYIYILNSYTTMMSSKPVFYTSYLLTHTACDIQAHDVDSDATIDMYDLPFWDVFSFGEPLHEKWDADYSQGGMRFLSIPDRYWGIEGSDYRINTDSITTDRMFSTENISWRELMRTVILTTIITIAVVTATTVLSVKLKKYRTKKKYEAQQKVVQAKDQYDNGQISFNDYYKETKRYNLKSKIFGYESYDPVNAWFSSETDSTASNQEGSSNSNDLKTIIYLLSGH